MILRLNRRAFLGAVAAIPLAGIKVIWPEKVLTYVPLVMDRTQAMMNMLFSAHVQNVRQAMFAIPEEWIYSDRMVEEEDL